MRRLIAVVVVLLIVTPAFAGTANAYETWCFDDPIVEIDGEIVAIVIGVRGDPAAVDKEVKRAETVIYVPKGVKTRKVSATNAYFKESVQFRTIDSRWRPGEAIPVRVEVSFTASAELPARIEITHDDMLRGTASGTTSDTITARFTLP